MHSITVVTIMNKTIVYWDILRQRPEVISTMCYLCEAMMDIYQFSKKSGSQLFMGFGLVEQCFTLSCYVRCGIKLSAILKIVLKPHPHIMNLGAG